MDASLKQPLATLLIAAADDKLMLGHRNSDWTGLGPILEEDIAFSSFAQDDLAHAQALYEFAGKLTDQDPDHIALGRAPESYLCASIVEVPDEFNWAVAIVRLFICNHYNFIRFARLARSNEKPLADLASRLAAEQQICVEHVDDWMMRLGGGTEESRTKMQAALNTLAPFAADLHAPTEDQQSLEDAGLYPPLDADHFTKWLEAMHRVLTDAGLTLNIDAPASGTTRGAAHTEHLAPAIEEMTEVYRIDPQAKW